MTDQGRGEAHQADGDAAMEHELAGEYEERDGEQREDGNARDDPLKGDEDRKAFVEEDDRRRQPHGEGDGNADEYEKREQAEQYRQSHV